MQTSPKSQPRVSSFVHLAVLAYLLANLGCSSATQPPSQRGGTRGTAGQAATSGALAGGYANPGGVTLPGNGGAAGAVANPSQIPPGSANPSTGVNAGAASMTCAMGMQHTDPVTPTIWLIVDGSGSMNDDFEPGRSRWQALRATLMDPGGVVDSLQAVARFGMVIYAGGGEDATECVQLVTVQPDLNNLSKLSAQYPMQPLGMGTPTDKALENVVNNLPVLNMAMLDQFAGPVYVVLATDGQPNDMCDAGGGLFGGGGGRNNAAVEQSVIDITTRGTEAGMQMYVISLAGEDTRLQSHLAQVAEATVSKTPPFVPATQTDLVAAFRKIIGGATCVVSLSGMVMQGRECSGHVTLNTTDLKCNDPDGWKLLDPSTVQLMGSACTSFVGMQSVVSANFPCDVFTPD